MPDTNTPTTAAPAQALSWRDKVKVHPAADLFPMMSDEEIDALAADTKKNGLQSPIVYWRDPEKLDELFLLDGRNRLEAAQRAGYSITLKDIADYTPIDPYAYVVSANIHRRHLTAEQRRDLIANLLKVSPEKSDRAIAKTVKTDHKTVGKVRREAEARGEIPHVEKRTDTKGRQQPAKKSKPEAAEVERDRAEARRLFAAVQAAEAERAAFEPVADTPVDDDDPPLTDADRKKQFLLLASGAIEYARTLLTLDIKPDAGILEAARCAADEWTTLAERLGDTPAPALQLPAGSFKVVGHIQRDIDTFWYGVQTSPLGAMWEAMTPEHRDRLLKMMRKDARDRKSIENGKANNDEVPDDDAEVDDRRAAGETLDKAARDAYERDHPGEPLPEHGCAWSHEQEQEYLKCLASTDPDPITASAEARKAENAEAEALAGN